MAHEEFPPLQLSGKSILCAALASRINMIGGVRPFVAAVIRETARQAQEAGCANNLVSVSDLLLIADNLHSPPPPPPSPTREEMDSALKHLLPHLFLLQVVELTDGCKPFNTASPTTARCSHEQT
jgi:hypothetical protein